MVPPVNLLMSFYDIYLKHLYICVYNRGLIDEFGESVIQTFIIKIEQYLMIEKPLQGSFIWRK